VTIGQAVGGAVGAVGGFFLGNPLIGFQIGMGIGSFIDPPSAEEPNQSLQTQDLQFNVFTRNLPVPIVYGTCRVAGNILWIGNTFTEIVEREATEGGKGAPDPPKTREVWYHADFAMALSEGEIAGVTQVKVDDEDFTDTEGLNYTVYDGDAAQGPDSLVVGALGANAPAFRNTGYLLFTGRLGRANRVPNVTAIVDGVVLTGETFTDTFSRSDAGSLGENWREHGSLSGVWSVASNQARTGGGLAAPNWARIGVVASAFLPAKNMRVSVRPRGPSSGGAGFMGVEARVQSLTQEAYALFMQPGGSGEPEKHLLHLVRFTGANSYVFLAGSVAAAFKPGNVLTLVVSESLISAEINGIPVIPPKSDGTIQGVGFAGMISQTATRYVDDFMAGIVGNPRSYAATFADDFNRANATDLGSRWQHQYATSNAWEIQGSVAFISQGFFAREWLVPGAVNFDPKVSASVRLVDLGTQVNAFTASGTVTGRGVEVRGQNSSHAAYIGVFDTVNSPGVAAQSRSIRLQIGMATALNSITVLKSGGLPAGSVASGDRFGLEADGSTLSLFINSLNVLQVTDTTIQSAGTVGLYFDAKGAQADPGRLDDFQVHVFGNLGRTGAETSVFATGNPVIQVKDLLTKKRYGLGLPISRIERASFEESAAFCDELIAAPDGTLEKRFVLDIVLDQGRSVLDHLRDMLSTFRGFLVWAGGTVKIRIERAEEVSQSFSMGSIVADSFQWRRQSYRDRANVVRVEYINAADDHRRDFVEAFDDWDIDATGERRERTLRLQGIKRPSQAQRMATFYLDQSIHCSNACSFRVGIAALKSEVGDVIEVSHDVPAWVAKKFRILQIEEAEDDELTLTCLEYNAAIYHDRANAVQPSLAQPLNAAALPYHVGRFTAYKRRNEDVMELAFTRLQSADNFAGALMYRRRGTGGDFVQLDGTALALAPTAYLDSQVQSVTHPTTGAPSAPPGSGFTDAFSRTNADSLGGDWVEVGQDIFRVQSHTLQRGDPTSGDATAISAAARTNSKVLSGDVDVQGVMFHSDGLGIRPRVGLALRWQDAGSYGQFYSLEYLTRSLSHSILEVGIFRVTSGEVSTLLSAAGIASGTYFSTPASATEFRFEARSYTLTARLNSVQLLSAVDSWIQGQAEGGVARVVVAKGYPDVVRADSPIAYWRLGETAGKFGDWAGHVAAREGTLQGSATRGAAGLLDGDRDGAVDFQNSGWITTSFQTRVPSMFSLEAWVVPQAVNSGDVQEIISKRSYFAAAVNDFPVGFQLNASGTLLTMHVDAGGDFSADLSFISSAFAVGTRHHLVGTYDAAEISLFVDGVFHGKSSSKAVIPSSNAQFWTLARAAQESAGGAGRNRFLGRMDEAAIYDTALSSARVIAHYRAGIGSGDRIATQGERWDDFSWKSAPPPEVNSPILVRGLPDGWAARLFNPSSVVLVGNVASAGMAVLSLGNPAVQPASGFLQVFADQSFTSRPADGRFPASGFADFRGGDLYDYDRDLAFISATQTFLPIYNAKGGFANIGSVRVRAEEMGYSTFTDSRLEGVTRGAAGTPATSHSNLMSLGAFVVTTGPVGSQSLLDLTAAAANPLSNMPFFADNSTYVYLGGPSRFSRMGMFLERNASSVVSMAYEYSTGDGTWASLVLSGFIGPTDLTSGLLQTGPIFVEPAGDWSPTNRVSSGGSTIGDASSRYYLRMLRTSSLLATPPRELEILLDGDLVVAGRKENAYLYAPVVQDSMQALFFKAIAVGVVGQMAEGTKAPTTHVWSA
jgi:hypothetical protein